MSAPRRIFLVTEELFQTAIWNDGDIDSLEIYTEIRGDKQAALITDFEEFFYRFPRLLKNEYENLLLFQTPDWFFPLSIDKKEAETLLFPILPGNIDDITLHTVDSPFERTVYYIDRRMNNFIERSFSSFKCYTVDFLILHRWRGETEKDNSFSLFLEEDNRYRYFGFLDPKGAIVSRSISDISGSRENLMYFIKRLIETYLPDKSLLNIYTGIEWAKESFNKILKDCNLRFLNFSELNKPTGFNVFINDNQELLLPMKIAMMKGESFYLKNFNNSK